VSNAALILLAAALSVAALLAQGCGPRTTFDPYDRIAIGPITRGERVDPEVATATAEVAVAAAHYLTAGRLFREAMITTATADERTVIATPHVSFYALDRDRPFGIIIGGRARGHAFITWTFTDPSGRVIWEEEIRSIARDYDGIYTDLPPEKGGLDATAEGAGAYLLWWARKSKTNPRQWRVVTAE